MFERIAKNRRTVSSVLVALSLLGGTAFAAKTYFAGDCCRPGAACCKPGAPCCHHDHEGAKARVD
ncbi:MAG: hypothetical protein U0169_15925 [Polyangiaceae bacterium]